MVPALTSWPAKRLTPSRCPGEFRPFTDDPPPFLCAIKAYLSPNFCDRRAAKARSSRVNKVHAPLHLPPRSLGVVEREKGVVITPLFALKKVASERDVTDLNRRVILPVPALDLVLPARLVLQHRQLPVAALRHDLAHNLGARGILARQQLLVVGAHGNHFTKSDLPAHFAGQRFHLHGFSRRDAILLASTADYGVHPASNGNWETSIIRAPSRPVNAPIQLAQPADHGSACYVKPSQVATACLCARPSTRTSAERLEDPHPVP